MKYLVVLKLLFCDLLSRAIFLCHPAILATVFLSTTLLFTEEIPKKTNTTVPVAQNNQSNSVDIYQHISKLAKKKQLTAADKQLIYDYLDKKIANFEQNVVEIGDFYSHLARTAVPKEIARAVVIEGKPTPPKPPLVEVRNKCRAKIKAKMEQEIAKAPQDYDLINYDNFSFNLNIIKKYNFDIGEDKTVKMDLNKFNKAMQTFNYFISDKSNLKPVYKADLYYTCFIKGKLNSIYNSEIDTAYSGSGDCTEAISFKLPFVKESTGTSNINTILLDEKDHYKNEAHAVMFFRYKNNTYYLDNASVIKGQSKMDCLLQTAFYKTGSLNIIKVPEAKFLNKYYDMYPKNDHTWINNSVSAEMFFKNNP